MKSLTTLSSSTTEPCDVLRSFLHEKTLIGSCIDEGNGMIVVDNPKSHYPHVPMVREKQSRSIPNRHADRHVDSPTPSSRWEASCCTSRPALQSLSMAELAMNTSLLRCTQRLPQQAQRLRKARKTSLHRHLLCIDESKELLVATTSSSNSKSLEATFNLVESLLDDAIKVANKSAQPDVGSCRIHKVNV